MTTFIVAYLIVWLAVCLYVARLDGRQRRLESTVAALRAQISGTEDLRSKTQDLRT